MIQAEQLARMVDSESGLVDRRIYYDEDIYRIELERIFARAWNFMAHDSQIPNPGDFFLSFIGEDRVIIVRDKELQVQVLVNSCRHRGNAVCRAEEGHATSFMCTYHGWTYDLKGALVGVPGFKELYHEDIDRENWGLVKAAKVQSYKGFIFATMDNEAPDLEEYLGDVGLMSLDFLAVRGELVIMTGIQKFVIGCNWKFAVDNVWDYYHADLTHASAYMARFVPGKDGERMRTYQRFPVSRHQLVVFGEYGHAIGGPGDWADDPVTSTAGQNSWLPDTDEAREALGNVGMRVSGHPHIFPNTWVRHAPLSVTVRFPKGPTKTEIWRFGFVCKEWDAARQKREIDQYIQMQGPAGLAEVDDAENWSQSTSGAAGLISRNFPLHYAMGHGHNEVHEDELEPPHVDGLMNEHAQLWYYRNWQEWMNADSWQSLVRSRPALPKQTV